MKRIHEVKNGTCNNANVTVTATLVKFWTNTNTKTRHHISTNRHRLEVVMQNIFTSRKCHLGLGNIALPTTNYG